MRLSDIEYVDVPAGPVGSPLRGTRRLLRDLVCVGSMEDERPSAIERLEATLGRDLATVVRSSVVGPDPAHRLRPRRAA